MSSDTPATKKEELHYGESTERKTWLQVVGLALMILGAIGVAVCYSWLWEVIYLVMFSAGLLMVSVTLALPSHLRTCLDWLHAVAKSAKGASKVNPKDLPDANLTSVVWTNKPKCEISLRGLKNNENWCVRTVKSGPGTGVRVEGKTYVFPEEPKNVQVRIVSEASEPLTKWTVVTLTAPKKP